MVIYQVLQKALIFHLYLCAAEVLTFFITIISQEELKIVNLIYTLLLDEELDTREAGLHKFLIKKKKEKVSIIWNAVVGSNVMFTVQFHVKSEILVSFQTKILP